MLLSGDCTFRVQPPICKTSDLGWTESKDRTAHVTVHPPNFTPVQRKNMPPSYTYGHLTDVAMGRLTTSLHEVVHAFIGMYACTSCPSHNAYVEHLEGHGLVWQRIVNYAEHAASHAMGLPLRPGRFEAIQAHWKSFQKCPHRTSWTSGSL